ncbi:MAG: ABC transporter substrate-binding protein [Clostridia bacterium]|nr:ABC transporter substrate-binding protein [Clostridia bacterium]
MKKTIKTTVSILLAVLIGATLFACTAPKATEAIPTDAPVTWTEAPIAAESTPEPQVAEPEILPTDAPVEPTSEPQQTSPVRVAALAGPTGVGLAFLPEYSEQYQLELFSAPDQAVAKFLSGEADIAAVPINLAATLYKKTEGNVAVIAVNTLGVLYFVENGNTIHNISDLAGKTVYATGQASTPQYILEKILADNGLSDIVTVEYIAEGSALAAQLAEDNDTTIAFLPEPMVSVACAKSETVHVALSANELWKANNDAEIVQGVYIVRKDYLADNETAVELFLRDAAASVERVLTDENAADAVVSLGIIGNAGVAKRAIPNCNIVLIRGEQMQKLVSSMLETLYNAAPSSVGGALPTEDFYYTHGS